MNLKEYLKLSYKRAPFGRYSFPRPAIVCKDGFTVSIQGSSHHYCTPKDENVEYSHLEIGFPEPFDNWLAETLNEPVQDVYGYVSCNIIDTLLERHGGIDEEAMLATLTMMELVDETC